MAKFVIKYFISFTLTSGMMMYLMVGLGFALVFSSCSQVVWVKPHKYRSSAVTVQIGPVPLIMRRDKVHPFQYSEVSSDALDYTWDDPEQHISWECIRMLGEDILCTALTWCDCPKRRIKRD